MNTQPLLLHEWAGTSKGVNESVEVRLSKAFDVALQVVENSEARPPAVIGIDKRLSKRAIGRNRPSDNDGSVRGRRRSLAEHIAQKQIRIPAICPTGGATIKDLAAIPADDR